MDKKYQNIVILTGAGISAESGLATFRGANGLWNNYNVQDVASVEGFARNPILVHQFYNELRPEILRVKPNAAHFSITNLQKKLFSKYLCCHSKYRHTTRTSWQ
ncbi:MAG: Sir2 family NAD-dependent protein deacetylase [Alphaproteobacteria bacterium]